MITLVNRHCVGLLVRNGCSMCAAVAAIVLALITPTGFAGEDAGCSPFWDNEMGQPGPIRPVRAIRRHQGIVYAGSAESLPDGIRRYVNGQWQVGSVFGQVLSLNEFEGDLIVTGAFKVYFDTPDGQGVTYNVARFNGSTWSELDGGTDDEVYTSIVHDGDLIIGGDFWYAGGKAIRYIARFDGDTWHPIGQYTGAVVQCLASYEGLLVAGANNRVAVFDGEQWTQLGGTFNSQVTAMAVYDGSLIVGGAFTTAGGSPANRIVRWSGEQWIQLGDGLSGSVRALELYGGDLVAALSTSNAALRLVRFDGRTWSSLGQGANGPVWAIFAEDETLYVGGTFQSVGGSVPAKHVAAWVECPSPPRPGDLNGDGVVNAQDLAILLSYWGVCNDCDDCLADINGDCVVNAQDLAILLSYWG